MPLYRQQEMFSNEHSFIPLGNKFEALSKKKPWQKIYQGRAQEVIFIRVTTSKIHQWF